MHLSRNALWQATAGQSHPWPADHSQNQDTRKANNRRGEKPTPYHICGTNLPGPDDAYGPHKADTRIVRQTKREEGGDQLLMQLKAWCEGEKRTRTHHLVTDSPFEGGLGANCIRNTQRRREERRG